MNRELDTLIRSNRIPHALVIDGGTYESRLSLAHTVAASLLCSGDTTAGPCRRCTACNKVFSDIHPDVITVLPDKKKKTLSVEVIRDMREDVSVLPNESEHKIYIIAKAELMQDYAQNALLKILEEPPAYASFILLCDSHSSLLPTVLSRVALFSLDDEEPDMDEGDNKEALEVAKQMAECIAHKDEFALMTCVSFFDKNYELLKPALERLSLILRDALVLVSGGSTMISLAEKQAKEISALPRETLLSTVAGLTEIQKSINIYGNKNLILCRLSSKLIGGKND